MNTRALILLVSLVMTYPAHAQCQRHFTSNDPVCPVGDPSSPAPGTFLYKVCDLKLPYDPSDPTNTTSYSSPACNGTTLARPFLTQLKDAFNLAPDDVKRKLCALNQVFVAPSGSFAATWGIWEFAPAVGSTVARRGNGGTYIAIPDSVLTLATSLAAAEKALYASLFNLPSYSPLLPSISSTGTVANTQGAGTLAILAHELGHILLADTNADGTGGSATTGTKRHPRSFDAANNKLCDIPTNNCFEQAFLEGSSAPHRWNLKKFHDNMRRWIAITTGGDQHGNKHQNGAIDFEKIWKEVDHSNFTNATNGIRAIYNSGELVSLVAAVSPEEDFVETYKYKVLAAAQDPSTSEKLNLTIGIANPGKEVLGPVRRPIGDLGQKINCVNLLVP
jgi:hypothetical protein